MFLIGLTGGIATGKSTVSNILQSKYNCPVVDADKIARDVVKPGTVGWRKIKQKFGTDVLQENGELDREKLGQITFSDPNKRKLLNSITHPGIYKAMLWSVFKLFITGHQFAVLDLPLLSSEQQLQRLMNRNDLTKEEAEKRINSQMSLADKCKKATHIIDNNGDISSTEEQVLRLYHEFKAITFIGAATYLCSYFGR
ncbi:hypothetical protein KUTeg_008261 [Tegillarca granosa]|uniref:Dephospho-CoA kinase domain-containing protein n=1 Tax=Tegillarca granosa TaxID=220873 RepID=A0ABQ9F8N6_TEGGR|nr:hypothetical protein KUTeg_008261 [Tegillarca granosa]